MIFTKKRMDKISANAQDFPTQNNCPNCWGDQEYENVIRKKYRDPQIGVNNFRSKYSFVRKFMVTYLSGIKLKRTTLTV